MPGEQILVIDDNLTNLKLLELLLRSEGYVMLAAQDAEQAELVLTHLSPALILMDLQLPGVDGLTLTRRLKADPRTSAIPIVAVTSSSLAEDEGRAAAAGCAAYVTKPIDTRSLPKLIAAHLAPRATRPTDEG